MTRPGADVPGTEVAVPGVPGLVVMTMYCAPGVPATPFGTAVMILAGVVPAGLGDAITMVCLPAADCATAVPGLATAPPGVPSTPPARPLMIAAPLGSVWTHTWIQTQSHACHTKLTAGLSSDVPDNKETTRKKHENLGCIRSCHDLEL